MQASQRNQLKNKTALKIISPREVEIHMIYAPFLGQVPDKTLEIGICSLVRYTTLCSSKKKVHTRESVLRPVEARTQIIHKHSPEYLRYVCHCTIINWESYLWGWSSLILPEKYFACLRSGDLVSSQRRSA